MPDRDRVVVSNTTPIIALALIKNLDLLQRLYGEVIIPPAVHEEISAGGENRAGVIELRDAAYIKMGALSDPDRAALIEEVPKFIELIPNCSPFEQVSVKRVVIEGIGIQ